MKPNKKLSLSAQEREELHLHRHYRQLLINECGTDDIAVLSSLRDQVSALSEKLSEVESMIMPYKGECSPEAHRALCSLVPKLIIEKVALKREIKRIKAIGYLERISKQHRTT